MDLAVGHHHRLGADDTVALGGDAGQALAGLHRLRDRGPDGGEIRTAAQERRDRDQVLELPTLRHDGGLTPQRLHEQPVVGHGRILRRRDGRQCP